MQGKQNARPKERTVNKAAKEQSRLHTEKGKFVAKTECKVRWTEVLRTRLLKS